MPLRQWGGANKDAIINCNSGGTNSSLTMVWAMKGHDGIGDGVKSKDGSSNY